jgi:hypothetical protein
MYQSPQKKSSSWTPTSIQKKSKSFSKPGSSAVQAKRDANSAQSQDMPSYSTAGADLLTASIMRSVDTQEQEQVETSTVQRQSNSGRAAVAATAPPIVSIPVVQPNSVGIQTKLTVGAIGDVYEQEADRVAAQVMSMPVAAAAGSQVQRFGVEDSPVGMYSSLAQSITPVVHRRVDEQVQMRELVQREFQAGGNQASGDLESRLNASKGGGSALAPEVRAFMEPRFGADFSSVRVHTGSEAVQMNRELRAQAFAHGSDVYFGAGKEPGNNELTAHELTHVVQQTGGVQTKLTLDQTDVQRKCSACEQEEETVQRSLNVSAVSDSGIQRWSLFGDDEDKTESESSSSGGILDWVEEKASGAVDTVTQAGSDAYNWATETGGAAVDTVTQAGNDAYSWATETGGAAVDTVTQAGSDAYNWATETVGRIGNTITDVASSVGEQVEKGVNYLTGRPERERAERERPERERDNPGNFCTPYTSRAEIYAAKTYLWTTLIPSATGMFGADVAGLWRQYLSGRSSGYRTFAKGSNIANAFAQSNVIRQHTEILMARAITRLDRFKALTANTWVDIPVANVFTADEINFPINFNNPFDIPGHIAGGASGSDFGPDTRKLKGHLSVYRESDDTGNTIGYQLKAKFEFEVKDAVDFCPGGAGAGLEQVLTIPASRLEASSEAFDVPFEVQFAAPEITRTISSASSDVSSGGSSDRHRNDRQDVTRGLETASRG